MAWELVKINNNKSGKYSAYASIGFGSIELSSAACDLVENVGKYKYVQLYKTRQGGGLRVGIKLMENCAENTIKVTKRKVKGEVMEKSVCINNKPLMEEIFGIQGTQNKATRYSVKLDEQDHTMLVIYGE